MEVTHTHTHTTPHLFGTDFGQQKLSAFSLNRNSWLAPLLSMSSLVPDLWKKDKKKCSKKTIFRFFFFYIVFYNPNLPRVFLPLCSFRRNIHVDCSMSETVAAQPVVRSCFVSSQIWTVCDSDNIQTRNNFTLLYSGLFLPWALIVTIRPFKVKNCFVIH